MCRDPLEETGSEGAVGRLASCANSFSARQNIRIPRALPGFAMQDRRDRFEGENMLCRNAISAFALAGALAVTLTAAQAFDDSKYPDLSGQWLGVRIPGVGGQPGFDPTKPWGLGQQAPLTPEYQKVLEASIADQAAGGQGNWHTGAECLPPGMPGMMTLFQALQIIVLPEITYMLIDHGLDSHRRIYTDGRGWPKEVEPTFLGYSIGKWIDENGDGRFDVLEIETRNFKGPRTLDPAGMPTHADNQSIVKERIFFDKTDPKLLTNEITLIDHAYTRPWKVVKHYRRNPSPHPDWQEYDCIGDNVLMKIGNETYYKSSEGRLMPTRKDQPPPDLKYFKQVQK
jgi:hypothetical protein